MLIATAAPADDGDELLDWDLFGLELEHQFNQRIKPEIKRTLDRRDAAFQAELNGRPDVIAERVRIAQEQDDYGRRKERRQFVDSGEAARAALRPAPNDESRS